MEQGATVMRIIRVRAYPAVARLIEPRTGIERISSLPSDAQVFRGSKGGGSPASIDGEQILAAGQLINRRGT
ncbi:MULTISPECIES: hypothetical protein [unclassified Arthrobacter]|uniref:hypothetical protein n=1 Tax=unclassified Arthrobacter TaxID=235627 RepID=UPI002157B20E|nr:MULTISPECIES: hypothetical protein [unclassified Arthrobacter]